MRTWRLIDGISKSQKTISIKGQFKFEGDHKLSIGSSGIDLVSQKLRLLEIKMFICFQVMIETSFQ